MNGKFEFLDHTADTKVRAYGGTLEEAFGNVVLASTMVMTSPDKIQGVVMKKVSVSASNIKALLYDFIEEILFLLDTEGFIVKESLNLRIVKSEKGFELFCELLGDFIREEYDVHSAIKAVTYSEMEIIEGDNFIIQVVFDL